MIMDDLLHTARTFLANPDSPPPSFSGAAELAPLAELLFTLIAENHALKEDHGQAIDYLRRKIDQLLVVIGTIPLRPEELDNASLISIDPIGIIAESFTQILAHLRQTNEKLEVAMEEIQAIFEAVGGGILVLDTNKQILSYNHKLQEMFGREGESLLGRTCKDLICRGTAPRGCVFDAMMQSGRPTAISHCAGTAHHYNITATPVKDRTGAIIRAVLLYTDISELMAAKDDLADEKERLSLTLESIAEGVVATDTSGSVVLMNRVAETLSGWGSGDALGRQICEIFPLHPDQDNPSCFDLFADVLLEGSQVQRIANARLCDRTGNSRLITVSVAPIRRGNQQDHTGAIFVFRDITHEKALEEELFKASKIESLGVLAGGIAHDFNNLLTSILGNIAMAKRHLHPDDRIYQFLNDSERASSRARSLTHQLLTFAKGGAPIQTLTSSSRLISEAARFAATGSRIKCTFTLAGDLWNVTVDEGQIGQVIQNLVINADQAMPAGGIVSITGENIIIDAADNVPLQPGRHIKIGIHDRGAGIDHRYLDKIFDPYFTTKETGHGLGLAISYSIIKKHQGHIHAEPRPGGGTSFFVYLPAAGDKVPDTREQPGPTSAGQGKILVMDDEEMVRDVAVQMLELLGYQADGCADGKEAIACYQEAERSGRPYDAVIMDLTIPGGMGGKDALAALQKITPTVRAIVSSGYANDPIMADFRRYGFSAVVPKPYDVDQLGTVISRVLGQEGG